MTIYILISRESKNGGHGLTDNFNKINLKYPAFSCFDDAANFRDSLNREKWKSPLIIKKIELKAAQ